MRKLLTLIGFIFTASTMAGLLLLTPLKKASSSFTPNSIAGLSRWFDPRYGVTTNGSNQITNWVDQSSNADFATPPTAAQGLVLTSNSFGSLPGAVGTQANDTIETLNTPLSGLTAFTIFSIINSTSPVPTNQNIICAVSGNSCSVYFFSAGIGFQTYDGSNFENFVSALTGATAHLVQVQSKTSPSTEVVKIDGVALTPNTGGGSSWNMAIKWIGGGAVGGRHFDGAMGPQIIYNTSLSDADCTLVSNWLHNDGWY